MTIGWIKHGLEACDVFAGIVGPQLKTVLDLLPERNVLAFFLLHLLIDVGILQTIVFEIVIIELGSLLRLEFKRLRFCHSFFL